MNPYRISLILIHVSQHPMSNTMDHLQVFIVTGGEGISSTELLVAGSLLWQEASALLSPRGWMGGVTLGNNFFIIGE